MNRFHWIIIIIFAIAGYYYFISNYDRMPSAYDAMLKQELELNNQHNQIIKQLADQNSKLDKRELAQVYISESKLWIIEFEELASNYKKISKGLSMRKRSQLATKTLQIRKTIQMIEETKVILSNALDGKIASEHEKILKFDPNQAYRKMFKNIPEQKK